MWWNIHRVPNVLLLFFTSQSSSVPNNRTPYKMTYALNYFYPAGLLCTKNHLRPNPQNDIVCMDHGFLLWLELLVYIYYWCLLLSSAAYIMLMKSGFLFTKVLLHCLSACLFCLGFLSLLYLFSEFSLTFSIKIISSLFFAIFIFINKY